MARGRRGGPGGRALLDQLPLAEASDHGHGAALLGPSERAESAPSRVGLCEIPRAVCFVGRRGLCYSRRLASARWGRPGGAGPRLCPPSPWGGSPAFFLVLK